MTNPKPPNGKTRKTAGVTKIPQPHGGALNSGGVPGNAGSPGRPDLGVRVRSAAYFGEALEVLHELAVGKWVGKKRKRRVRSSSDTVAIQAAAELRRAAGLETLALTFPEGVPVDVTDKRAEFLKLAEREIAASAPAAAAGAAGLPGVAQQPKR